MCGISGYVLREGERAREEDLRQMASAMRRRGPDAEGIHVAGNTGLAHRRLKVIDLSSEADQPLFSRDGKVGIVFNGEIYNFLELRRELEGLGRRFRTRSDTEVIVQAYEEWGTGAFARFNGMFAFALHDVRGQTPALYLARDRFGIKPLFYAAEGGRLAFASELKPLLELPWIRREIRPETLFHFLKFSHVPHPLSILDGVSQLEPGRWLRFERGSVAEASFVQARRQREGGGVAGEAAGMPEDSEDRWLDELDAVLKSAVSRQLVADVPVGCFLSGGIDSSLLTLTGCALLGAGGPRFKTFSIGYSEKEFDETHFARQAAEIFGSEHHELQAAPEDFYDLIPDVPLYFDQPFADPTLLPSLLLARFARQEVTVALAGDGGDELFFGYPYQRALLFLTRLGAIPRGARAPAFELAGKLASGLARGPGRRLGQRIRKLADILQFSSVAELYQYFVGTVGPLRMDRLAALIEAPVDLSVPVYSGLLRELEGLPLDEQIGRVFMRTFLVDTVLAKTDRAGMAFGLEARVPFLDNAMAEFAERLPFRFKKRGGASKYLLRRLLARKLGEKGMPAVLSARGKRGFSVPMRDWLRGDLKYLLDEYLNEPRLRREGILSAPRVRALVREHLDHGANHSHLLWSLVSFEMWKERYCP